MLSVVLKSMKFRMQEFFVEKYFCMLLLIKNDMCVCMYIRMYIRMYVCMYLSIHPSTYLSSVVEACVLSVCICATVHMEVR